MLPIRNVVYAMFVAWGHFVASGSIFQGAQDPEIVESLKRNIKMDCKWSNPWITEIVAADFNVSVYPPSAHDLKEYLEQPSTLTQSNPHVLFAANLKNYDDKWAADKKIQWTIPDEHPGQNKANCLNILKTTTTGSVDKFYDVPKRQMRNFYTLNAKEAYIHPTGMVGLSCGFYIGLESCENRFEHIPGDWKWEKNCVPYLRTQEGKKEWETLWKNAASKEDGVTMGNSTLLDEHCRYVHDRQKPTERVIYPRKYKRVFIMPSLWDYNYHHFVADSVARGVHHLKFLKDNVDVMIHIREFEGHAPMIGVDKLSKQGLRRMRENTMNIWGIDISRLVSGPLLVEEVFIPRPTACSNTLLNPFQIRMLAKQMSKGAYRVGRPDHFHSLTHKGPKPNTTRLLSEEFTDGVENNQRKFKSSNSSSIGKKKVMIIQQRFHESQTTDRQWTNHTFDKVVNAFQEKFPDHHIIRMSNVCEEWGGCCPACDITKYMHADILVGAHGAGLTNQMFMPPNSLVVEIVGDFKDVNMPVCGYYGTLAAVMGNHHYIYAYVYKRSLFMKRMLNETERDVYKFRPAEAAAGALGLYNRIHQNDE